jgi:hypothetical protein
MQLHRLIILFKKFLNVLFQILLICLSLPHYSMSITLLKLNFLPSRFSSYQCHLSFNKVYNKLCFKAITIILIDKIIICMFRKTFHFIFIQLAICNFSIQDNVLLSIVQVPGAPQPEQEHGRPLRSYF